eukprot:4070234-Amphidinium_carterae.2
MVAARLGLSPASATAKYLGVQKNTGKRRRVGLQVKREAAGRAREGCGVVAIKPPRGAHVPWQCRVLTTLSPSTVSVGYSARQLFTHTARVARALLRVPQKSRPALVVLLHKDLRPASVINAVHGSLFGMVRELLLRQLLTPCEWTAALVGEAGRLATARSPWTRVTGLAANFLLTLARLGWQTDEDGAVKIKGKWMRLLELSKLELKRL